ncbi:MAG: DotU family type IV/VI secretion system protein [Pseudomonadota bacterium]
MFEAGAVPRVARDALAEFQDIHGLISELKSQRWAIGPAEPDDDAPLPDAAAEAREAFNKLNELLRRMGAHPGSGDGYAERHYVLASFADEAMMHGKKWGAEGVWLDLLLERHLFGTQIAGDRLFEIGNEIVAHRDVTRRDVAMTIFLALSCGFRGRYRGQEDSGQIERLRHALYDVAVGEVAPRSIDWKPAFGQVLDDPMRAPNRPTVDKRRLYLRIIGGIVVAYLVASHIAWLVEYREPRRIADEILQMDEQLPVQSSSFGHRFAGTSASALAG